MVSIFRRLLAITVGLLTVMTTTLAYAEGKSGKRFIERLVHRPDRVVMVYAFPFKYKTRFWLNPDGCDTRKKVALVPNPDNPPETYDEQLATLVAAFAADYRVSFTLDGCYVKPDGESVPKIRLLSVYNKNFHNP